MGGGACAWGVLGGVGACGPVTSLGSERRYHTQVSDTPCVQPALDETTCTGCLTPT